MASIYDRADIYDLIEDEDRYDAYREHWKTVIEDKPIHTTLDVSIGTGSVTLPLLDLGISLSGSDLSESMLRRCRVKLAEKGFACELKRSDFRDLSCWDSRTFDMVASTGNSLAHVSNADVARALREMDRHVNNGGILCIDTRNWDKILAKKNRFYLYNPFFANDYRINLIQVWDYNADGTITFHLLYTFEKDNKIFHQESFEETYIPFARRFILDQLAELGYRYIDVMNFPAQLPTSDPEDADWITIVARKGCASQNKDLFPI